MYNVDAVWSSLSARDAGLSLRQAADRAGTTRDILFRWGRLFRNAQSYETGLRVSSILRWTVLQGFHSLHARSHDKSAVADLWYLVGVITSDGCLSPSGRHVLITSKDREYLELLGSRFGINYPVYRHESGYGTCTWRLGVGSRDLYDLCVEIGLTPRKSKTIGALKLPEDAFRPFTLGLIDGDGSIDPHNGRVRIFSGSHRFLDYMVEQAGQRFGITSGRIYPGNRVFTLQFSPSDSRAILVACYGSTGLHLARKFERAQKVLGGVG